MSLLLALGGAATPVNYVLTCDSGTYTYTGQAATLSLERRLTCDTGAYVYTGQDATLQVRRSLVCDVGSYVYTGNDAALTYVPGAVNYTLTCDSGSYVYTGQDATLSLTQNVINIGGGRRKPLPPHLRGPYKKTEIKVTEVPLKEEELATELVVSPVSVNPILAEALRKARNRNSEWKPSVSNKVINLINLPVKVAVSKPRQSIQDEDDEIFLMYG